MMIIDAISQPERVGARLQRPDALSDAGAKAGAGRARCRRSSSPLPALRYAYALLKAEVAAVPVLYTSVYNVQQRLVVWCGS